MSYLVLFFVFLHIHEKIKDDFNYEWYFYSLVFIGLFLFWLFFRYKWPYPKNKINKETGIPYKTGIVISLFSENLSGVRLKYLFLKELKKCFNDKGLDKYFEILTIANHQAEKIKNIKDIDKMHDKINGHIYFYGEIQKEKDGGNEKYFISLDGYVKHLPVPIPISKELSFDFRAVLPPNIEFSEFFPLRGVKATSKIIYLATKYIAGVASFISGNPFLAFDLHKDLKNEFNDYVKINKDEKIKRIANIDLRQIKKIKNKLPKIISNECHVIARIYFENNIINKSLEFLKISFDNNQNNPNTWLLKSVIDFQVDKNPKKALDSIKKVKKYSKGDYAWMYNYVFINFWMGRYDDALKMCKKISQQNYINEVNFIKEIEKFNLRLIKDNNFKSFQFYWLGFLNYKKKNNLPDALKYFEKFLNTNSREGELIKRANTYLSEIKRQMKI